MNRKKISPNRGFTLVEILVVLVIATVVISIAIPRIRSINKERNIREAAREVGSAFANASQRAMIDGVSGVRISRNANFVSPGSALEFAATEISILRKVPSYVGDAAGATIENELPVNAMTGEPEPNNQISIPMPLEQSALNIVRAGDSISIGGTSAKYRIVAVNTDTGEDGTSMLGQMQLILNLTGYLPAPVHDASFVIHRSPRILRSSTTELPENYIIDLRLSGFEVLDGFGPERPTPGGVGSFVPPYAGSPTILERQLTTVFEPAPTDFTGGAYPVVQNYDIEVIFDEEGAIDRVFYIDTDDEDGDGFNERISRTPLGPLYFFVTEAPNSLDTVQQVASADESALWVSVSNSGSTNIGYNNSNETAGLSFNDMSIYYFEAVDADPTVANDMFTEEDDRDEFNGRIFRSRNNAASSSVNQ